MLVEMPTVEHALCKFLVRILHALTYIDAKPFLKHALQIPKVVKALLGKPVLSVSDHRNAYRELTRNLSDI
ncbi:protein of unknown function [Cupriavidus taiwanensis]|uniref:Uncharacterized protein n=1 Tax=Cupriavidus taiwanensis TaxID=164546 RepID=A0A375IE31_9BURK|nr:protein of unknown function [Cupriavidus taiwanensis]